MCCYNLLLYLMWVCCWRWWWCGRGGRCYGDVFIVAIVLVAVLVCCYSWWFDMCAVCDFNTNASTSVSTSRRRFLSVVSILLLLPLLRLLLLLCVRGVVWCHMVSYGVAQCTPPVNTSHATFMMLQRGEWDPRRVTVPKGGKWCRMMSCCFGCLYACRKSSNMWGRHSQKVHAWTTAPRGTNAPGMVTHAR